MVLTPICKKMKRTSYLVLVPLQFALEQSLAALANEPLGDEPLAVLAQARVLLALARPCLLYTSPSPRDRTRSRMPSSA